MIINNIKSCIIKMEIKMSITIKTQQELTEICNELNIELPDFATPYFINKSFDSSKKLSEKLIIINEAINNDQNMPTISSIKDFFDASISNVKLPLYGSNVSCGFTSPAEDHVDSQLSLDSYLIPNPTATFFVRASGESMTGAGIFDGDLLIVDRSLDAKHESIILAVVDTEFTVKRMIKQNDTVILQAENPLYDDITIKKDQHFMVWGVVVHVIHHLR